VISELHYNPEAVDDALGEWVELSNPGEADVLLCGGWRLTDEGTESHEIAAELRVPAGGAVVLGRSADTAVNGGAPVDYAYGEDISLSDAYDQIALYFGDERFDAVAWDTSADGWAERSIPGASYQLREDRLDPDANDAPDSWCASEVPFGDGDLGTPGVATPGDDGCPLCDDASYTLTATADTNVDYGGGGINPYPDLVAYNDPGDRVDAVGYVRFELDALVYSEGDDWSGGSVTDDSLLPRGPQLAEPLKSIDNSGWNTWELDLDAWDWSLDVEDGRLSLGVDNLKEDYSYAYFWGVSDAEKLPELELEVCEPAAEDTGK
jgi:hypothetical protein